jgi:arsenite transporter
MFGKLLSALGGQGPILLVVSLGAGLVSPPLAHLGYSLLPVSAFLLTLGSFLTAGLAPSEARIRPSLIAIVLVWVGLALPLAASAALSFIPIDPDLRAGVLLSLLAPPVGSAAAIAAMLGLQPRLALIVSLGLTLIAPLSIPGFASVLGLGVAFDMGALATRLFSIIGAAALVAFACLKFRNRISAILPDQRAATGVAVLGLIVVGLATSQGIQVQLSSNPTRFEEMLAAAVATNFGLCVLGFIVFWGFGRQLAGTIGLVSGNRNVTLAWAAASFGLPPLAEGYVAACVIPVLALPLIVRLCIRLPALLHQYLPIPLLRIAAHASRRTRETLVVETIGSTKK